jgi:D-amino-acid dehydrogenase
MSNQEDILIIGGGVIGVCAAYYLAEKGQRVTLVEKSNICAGSSYGNAGLVASEHAIPLAAPGVLSQGLRWLLDAESPFYIKPRLDLDLLCWLWKFWAACHTKPMRRTISVLLRLRQAGSELFEHLNACPEMEFGYEQKGRLLLFRNQAAFEKGIKETQLLQEFGITAQILDADTVREMEPHVLPSIIGGIYYSGYAHVVPDRFVSELARVAENRGVCLQTETEVLGFETSGRRISTVLTTRGDFHPGQIVLAAGACSPVIARELGLRLPVQAAKGYSITVKSPPTSPKHPLFLAEGKVAVTPMGERLRFSSTLELAGLDLSINRRRLAATRRAAGEYLSDMAELELIEIWRGLRPTTPDTLPIIGRSSSFENLIIATGHGMLGMSHGPITGKLVSQLVNEETPSVDLTPFRAERFSEKC